MLVEIDRINEISPPKDVVPGETIRVFMPLWELDRITAYNKYFVAETAMRWTHNVLFSVDGGEKRLLPANEHTISWLRSLEA